MLYESCLLLVEKYFMDTPPYTGCNLHLLIVATCWCVFFFSQKDTKLLTKGLSFVTEVCTLHRFARSRLYGGSTRWVIIVLHQHHCMFLSSGSWNDGKTVAVLVRWVDADWPHFGSVHTGAYQRGIPIHQCQLIFFVMMPLPRPK